MLTCTAFNAPAKPIKTQSQNRRICNCSITVGRVVADIRIGRATSSLSEELDNVEIGDTMTPRTPEQSPLPH